MNAAAIWAMIFGMGLYQGLNPPMGWLPAVERGFVSGRIQPLIHRAAATSFGHFLAMLAVMLPVAALLALGFLSPDPLQRALALFMIGFGLYKLWRPRHPAFLARIPPDRPVKWSFLMAVTHCGSPMMMVSPLVTLYALMANNARLANVGAEPILANVGMAVVVSAAMIVPLLMTSGAIALALYLRRDLRAITKIWFNLDIGWAISMIAMGLMALWMSPMMVAPICRAL